MSDRRNKTLHILLVFTHVVIPAADGSNGGATAQFPTNVIRLGELSRLSQGTI
jgi:hypothetical protein